MNHFDTKETGLPWLPTIPTRWNIMRNKDFLVEAKETVGDRSSEYTLLSLTTQGIIPRDVESGKGKFPSDFSKYKIVSKGDIAFCLFDIDETPCTVGLSSLDGMLTGAYSIYHVNGINSRYLYHYYRALDNVKALKPLYTGLRKTISGDVFASIKLPVPDSDEQRQIADFLDWQESEINRLVSTKRREIGLLKEAEHIFIKNTVLGTHSKGKKQFTGLPWAPEVPEHWIKTRHKFLFAPHSEKVGDKSSEYTLLSLTTQGVIPRDIESGKGKFPSDFSAYQVVKEGHFVFCLFDVDETPRTVGIAQDEGMITGAYTVFNVKNADPKYLLYYFMMIDDEKAFRPLYSGLRKVINVDVFLAQSIYLPPLEEQKEIVKQIEAFLLKVQKAKQVYQDELDLLKEVRVNVTLQTISGLIDTREIIIPNYEYALNLDAADCSDETYDEEA